MSAFKFAAAYHADLPLAAVCTSYAIAFVLVLLFFVFAVMGMNLFSEAKRDGEFITNYNNSTET